MADSRQLRLRVIARHLLMSGDPLPPEGVRVLAVLEAQRFRYSHTRTASKRDVQAFLGSSGILEDLMDYAPEAWGEFHRQFQAALLESPVIRVADRVAETFKIDVGAPIWYGKYKNKRGIVREFKTNDKGDVIVTIEQVPNESGRKQPKEMKLFKIRPRQVEKEASAARVAARYQNKKKVKTQDGDEATVYEYSDRQVQHRNREKAKRVEKLRGQIDKLRRQIRGDLDSEDPQKRLVALAVALIDETYERVGNDGSAKDGHFGVTGWKVEHITFSQGKATLTYVGKSGVDQKKVVTNSKALKVLKEAVKGKDPGDSIFDGDDFKVTSKEVNEYLEPFDVTAKDLRGLHANEEMRSQLREQRKGKLPEDKKKREEKLKAEFEKALEAAAEAVGHEPSTLKSQYLVPGLEDAYLKDGTIPDKLDKIGSGTVVYLGRRGFDVLKQGRIWTVQDQRTRQTYSLYWTTATKSLTEREFASRAVLDPTESRGEDAQVFPIKQVQVEGMGVSWTPQMGTSFKTAIIHINNATDGPEDGDYRLRGFAGLTSSLTLYEQAVVQDMDIQGEPILGTEGSYTLRGRPIPDDVVMELVGAGYLDDEQPGGIVLSPMFQAKRRLYTARRLAARWLQGTKTPAEREDEEAEHLVRPAPKKKPPRYDLRRERPDANDDDDGDERQDRKDQSQNYKDIGASIGGMVYRVAYRYLLAAAEEGGGDPEWAKGQTYTHPETKNQVSFGALPPEEQAKLRAKHDEGGAEEDPEAKAKAEKEEKAKAKAKAEAEKAKATREAVGESTAVVQEMGGAAAKAHGKFSEEEQELFAEAYTEALDKLIENPPSTQDAVAIAAMTPGPGVINDPIELGDFLARQRYAQQVTLNPLMVDGQKPSEESKAREGGKLTREEVQRNQERSEASYDRYASMPPKQREDAFYKLYAESLGAEPGSPRHAELRSMMDGVALSMAMNGEDVPYMATVPQSYGALGKVLQKAEPGGEKKLLGTISSLSSSKSRSLIDTLLQDLPEEGLIEVAGGEGGPLTSWVRALQGKSGGGDEARALDPDQRRRVNSELRKRVLDSMTFIDPVVSEVLKESGGDHSRGAIDEYIPSEDSFDEAMLDLGDGEFQDQMTQSRTERMKGVADRLKDKAKGLSGKAKALWGLLSHAAEDPSVLDEEIVDESGTLESADLEGGHKPGDVWETEGGWRAMSPTGHAKTFEDKDQAETHAKGKGKGEGNSDSEEG